MAKKNGTGGSHWLFIEGGMQYGDDEGKGGQLAGPYTEKEALDRIEIYLQGGTERGAIRIIAGKEASVIVSLK